MDERKVRVCWEPVSVAQLGSQVCAGGVGL